MTTSGDTEPEDCNRTKRPHLRENAGIPTLVSQLAALTSNVGSAAEDVDLSIDAEVSISSHSSGDSGRTDGADESSHDDAPSNRAAEELPFDSFSDRPKERFESSQCRIATLAEMEGLFARVTVHVKNMQCDMHDSPALFYLLKGLKKREHQHDVKTPLANPSKNPVPLLTIPATSNFITDDVTVLREGISDEDGRTLFNEHFGDLRIDLPEIASTVLEVGTVSEKRDDSDTVANDGKCRLNFGCAGQDWKVDEDGDNMPAETYGFEAFNRIEDPIKRERVKRQLADVHDAMQACHDRVDTEELNGVLPFNSLERTNRYGLALRLLLNAEKTRQEDFSVQVKCLSRGDRVATHKDLQNCLWSSYDKTGALCFVFVDAFAILWSVKFLADSRAKLGHYYDRKRGTEAVHTRIKRHLQDIDHAYENFALDCGEHFQPQKKLTHKTPEEFCLGDFCPWEETALSASIKRDSIMLPASVMRDFWLAAPTTIVHRLRERGVERSRALRLAVGGGWQTGFKRFFFTGQEYEEEMVKGDPAKVFYERSMENFGSITGDPKGCNRVNPSGINFADVFLNPDGSMNDVMDKMVEDLEDLLDWIDETGPKGDDVFHHASVEARVRETLDLWKGYKCDIGEFRIMMIVQICALASYLQRGKHLLNIVYPVAKLGAAAQLVFVPEGQRQEVIERILQEFDLVRFGTNAAESLLCETSATRVGKTHESFMRGQHLFMLEPETGRPIIKRCGTADWEPVLIYSR